MNFQLSLLLIWLKILPYLKGFSFRSAFLAEGGKNWCWRYLWGDIFPQPIRYRTEPIFCSCRSKSGFLGLDTNFLLKIVSSTYRCFSGSPKCNNIGQTFVKGCNETSILSAKWFMANKASKHAKACCFVLSPETKETKFYNYCFSIS